MVQTCKILAGVFGHLAMEHHLRLMANTYRQHALILRAIRRRNPSEAARWMNYHIERSAQVVLEHMSNDYNRNGLGA